MYEQFFSAILMKRRLPTLSDYITQLYTTAECVFSSLLPSQLLALFMRVGTTFNQARVIKEENVLRTFENALAYMQLPRN